MMESDTRNGERDRVYKPNGLTCRVCGTDNLCSPNEAERAYPTYPWGDRQHADLLDDASRVCSCTAAESAAASCAARASRNWRMAPARWPSWQLRCWRVAHDTAGDRVLARAVAVDRLAWRGRPHGRAAGCYAPMTVNFTPFGGDFRGGVKSKTHRRQWAFPVFPVFPVFSLEGYACPRGRASRDLPLERTPEIPEIAEIGAPSGGESFTVTIGKCEIGCEIGGGYDE